MRDKPFTMSSLCLYIRELVVTQFLRYRSETLHTFFSSQEAAHLSEPPKSDNYKI